MRFLQKLLDPAAGAAGGTSGASPQKTVPPAPGVVPPKVVAPAAPAAQAAAKPETPAKPEAPKPGEKSKEWSSVLRTRQELQDQKTAQATEAARLKTEADSVAAREAKLAAAKADPLAALEALGIDFDAVAAAKIARDKAAKDAKAKPTEAKVEAKPEVKPAAPAVASAGAEKPGEPAKVLTVAEQVQAEMARAAQAAAKATADDAKAKFKVQQTEFFASDAAKEFVAIRALGGVDEVVKLVVEHVEAGKGWLDPLVAAKQVEEKLRKTIVELRDQHPGIMEILAPPTVIRRLSASPSKVSDVKSPPPAKATPAHVPSPSGSREQREQRADLERFLKLRDAARAAGMSLAEYRAQQAAQKA